MYLKCFNFTMLGNFNIIASQSMSEIEIKGKKPANLEIKVGTSPQKIN